MIDRPELLVTALLLDVSGEVEVAEGAGGALAGEPVQPGAQDRTSGLVLGQDADVLGQPPVLQELRRDQAGVIGAATVGWVGAW